MIFLGWYYDAELTRGVETGDTVTKNMTLYAKTAAGEEVQSMETPNYVTRTELQAGTYSFDVMGVTGESNIKAAVKFSNITAETKGTLNAFHAKEKVSDSSQKALQWAVGKGIILGKSDRFLDPASMISRAKTATILERYCKIK